MNMTRFITILLLLISTLAIAQPSSLPTSGGASQYILGKSDEVLMPINVWGFVGKPGQYMVPYGTDLVSLLSYAGGPREEAKIKKIRVVRASSQNEDGEVIEVDVNDFIENGNGAIIPTLKPGDTIVVSGTTFNYVRNSLEFVVRLAALVQIYAIVEYYTSRAND